MATEGTAELSVMGRLVYFADDLPGIPEDLLLARDRGEVLFITGAGVSTPAPSNLPGFGGLVIEITERLDAPLAQAMRSAQTPGTNWRDFANGLDAKQQTELKRFASQDYDVVLGMLERRMSRDPTPESRMRVAAAQVLDIAKKPNTLHSSLNILARKFGAPFMATTNFDRLHELAAGPRSEVRSYGLTGLPRPSRSKAFHGIFHIHGLLDKSNTPEIVLTDQDFGDVYLRRRIVADFIYDVTRIYNLVIIGYSANDAPFRYLLNAVAGDSLHYPDLKKRYAIVSCKSNDLTIAEDWRSRFIEPVCYDSQNNHEQLQRLMKAWAESVPQNSKDSWAEKKLRAICRQAPSPLHEYGDSVFGYIFKRANNAGRANLAALLGTIGAAPEWLTIANKIIRELSQARPNAAQ